MFKLEEALGKLFAWFCDHDMKVNAKKSQMIVFGTRQMLKNMPPVCIRFAGSIINESTTVKNLGIVMDKHLTFSTHVSSLVPKCTGTLIALNHAKHVLPPQVIKPIVISLVISLVRYCISVYGTCGRTELRRVQKVLNFCARIVSGRRKYDHVSSVLRELKWLSAASLVSYHRICCVHRIVEYGEPECLASAIVSAADHGHDKKFRNVYDYHVFEQRRADDNLCIAVLMFITSLFPNLTADLGSKRRLRTIFFASRIYSLARAHMYCEFVLYYCV